MFVTVIIIAGLAFVVTVAGIAYCFLADRVYQYPSCYYYMHDRGSAKNGVCAGNVSFCMNYMNVPGECLLCDCYIWNKKKEMDGGSEE